MTRTAAAPPEYAVLHDVSWEMYQALLGALGEHHARHTYDSGTLEIQSLLYGVSWAGYQAFLHACGDYALRHTYDGWHLELIMSPAKSHDWAKTLMGRFIEFMAFDLDIPIQSIGSTTIHHPDVAKGLQPDEAYYIAHEPQVRGKATFDPLVDPPPDLALEVDNTSLSLPRLPTFAALGVPEVWRYDGERLQFLVRQIAADGPAGYVDADRSAAFPFLRPADVAAALAEASEYEENTLVRRFLAVARQRHAEFPRGG